MSLVPDQQPDQQKEALLARSPFTKNFLDNVTLHSDPPRWSSKLENLSTELQNEIKSKEGNNWQRKITSPLLLTADTHDIFNPNMGLEQKNGATIALFLMGYEMGNDNWKPLLADIVVRFKELNFLNQKLLVSQEDRLKVVDVCCGILKVGAYYKELLSDTHSESNNKTPIPDSFKKFIDGLDLNGI